MARIVGMSRSRVFVKQLDMIPKIKVGVYILEKDIQKVGISLTMLGPSNWSTSRARLKPHQVIDSVNLELN